MTKGRGEWRGNMVKILEDRVGSNIYITLSDPGETMENWTRIPCCGQFESSSRMTIRIEFVCHEGDTLSFDWGLCCIVVHRPRIVWVLEESLRFERASPKKRTIGSVY